MHAVSKYLAHHAEPETRRVTWSSNFAQAVIIPAAGEGELVLRTLHSLPDHGPTLVILVLNARTNAPLHVHAANEETWRALDRNYERQGGDGVVPYSWPDGELLVVDRTFPRAPFPPKQGVGLARKIGLDLALAAYQAGALQTFVAHTTDADAQVPADYFVRIAPARGEAAWLYPFHHTAAGDPAVTRAVQTYEESLHYFVDGLRRAGSPYAYHSMGSTIALDLRCYAAVRGVPRRDAAEDFYLLNKLRKVGSIRNLHGEPVVLQGRISDRVPFGTGQATADLIQGKQPRFFYPPMAFDCLKRTLSILSTCAKQPGADLDLLLSAEPDFIRSAFSVLGLRDAVARARRASSHASIVQRHLDAYFDAFRTLKFIHFIRDSAGT